MASPAPAARPSTAAPQAAIGILSAISLCHGLNDLLQSVLPAVYPILKTAYRSGLRPDRLHHLHQHGHGVTASAGGRLHHGQAAQALLAGDRHGVHADRPAAALGGADLRRDPRRRRRSSASARRSSTRSRRASRGWPRAAATASRSRCFRSAATPGRRPDRCWPRSSCCPTASAASPGSASWPSSR